MATVRQQQQGNLLTQPTFHQICINTKHEFETVTFNQLKKGMNESSARNTIAEMEAKQLITKKKKGTAYEYKLTPKGRNIVISILSIYSKYGMKLEEDYTGGNTTWNQQQMT